LSLTKKMGFEIEYLGDGTVKGELSLKEEDMDIRCQIKKPEAAKEQPPKTSCASVPKEEKTIQETPKAESPAA
jgi:hypothetical protein